jgi:hypothetical protein
MDRVESIAAKIDDIATDASGLRILSAQMSDLEIALTSGLFSDGSLFAKTLVRTLDREQAVRYEKALVHQNGQRYDRAVVSAVRSLQANLQLSYEQSEELTRVLRTEARPPKRFGRAADVALVLFQVSRIPEEKIKPIFDNGQWRILSRWIAAYKRGEGGEEVLERNGFIFDEDGDAKPSNGERPEAGGHVHTGQRT